MPRDTIRISLTAGLATVIPQDPVLTGPFLIGPSSGIAGAIGNHIPSSCFQVACSHMVMRFHVGAIPFKVQRPGQKPIYNDNQ